MAGNPDPLSKLNSVKRAIESTNKIKVIFMIKEIFQVDSAMNWAKTNGFVAHMLVIFDEDNDSLWVPKNKVVNGKIILDISESAISNFELNENSLFFRGSVDKTPFAFQVPYNLIAAIYNKDTGESFKIGDHSIFIDPNTPAQ